MPRFVGIDLTCFTKNPTAYAVLTDGLKIRPPEFLYSDEQIIAAIERDQPKKVAIDSPLSRPEGLCCLNENCVCQPASSKKGRHCEQELAKIGIRSYFTTKKSIIKPMIERAMPLKDKLENKGYKVIEVYPYASKVRLWSNKAPQGIIPSKKRADGRKFLRECLSEVVCNIDEYKNLNHDIFDAIIAAYTAYLCDLDMTEPIGNPDEGQIVIPRVNLRLPV